MRVWAACNRWGNYHLPAYKIQCPSGRLVNCSLFSDNGFRLIKLVKPVITKHATDGSGVFRKNWKNLTSTQQATLVGLVHDVEPQLVEQFEGGWATAKKAH
jgi:hypothetical protein